MNIDYHDLKQLLYIVETLFGVFLIAVATYLFNLPQALTDPISYELTAIVLLVVGAVSVFWGVETYLLREDPDIWR